MEVMHDTHCALVYPVSWPKRERAHSTLLYLGQKDIDLACTEETARRVLSLVQAHFPDVITVNPFKYEFFGEQHDVRVLTVRSPVLDYFRSVIEKVFLDYGIVSPTVWGYNPHISLRDDDGYLPEAQELFFYRPEVWWA
jgi:hypothetical protein